MSANHAFSSSERGGLDAAVGAERNAAIWANAGIVLHAHAGHDALGDGVWPGGQPAITVFAAPPKGVCGLAHGGAPSTACVT